MQLCRLKDRASNDKYGRVAAGCAVTRLELTRIESEHMTLVVGIGGTPRENSRSWQALAYTLEAIEAHGVATIAVPATSLIFPMYEPGQGSVDTSAARFLALVQSADGLVIASPGYHGSVSGLLKNALDYLEDTVATPRPYLTNRPVGCIAVASGWQAAVTTLNALRDIVHALRGWPTPYGAAINVSDQINGHAIASEPVETNLRLVADQVVAHLMCREVTSPAGAGQTSAVEGA
jgi:FMN reductase